MRAGLGSLNLQDILTSTTGANNTLKQYLRDKVESSFSGQDSLFRSLLSQTGSNIQERLEKILSLLNTRNPDRITQTVFDDINKFIFSDPTGAALDKFLFDSLQNSEEKNVLSELLLNFLFNVDATIHGTTGIYLLDPIVINDFVNAAEGIYVVNSVVESLTPNSFNTVLNLKLYSPIESQKTQFSLNDMIPVTALDDITGELVSGYIHKDSNTVLASRAGFIFVVDNNGNFNRKHGVYNISLIRDDSDLSSDTLETGSNTVEFNPDDVTSNLDFQLLDFSNINASNFNLPFGDSFVLVVPSDLPADNSDSDSGGTASGDDLTEEEQDALRDEEEG